MSYESSLFVNGLFETVTMLAEFKLPNLSTADMAINSVRIADSHFQLGSFRQAMTFYEKALIAAKSSGSHNSSGSGISSNNCRVDSHSLVSVDPNAIRFKFAQCCWRMEDFVIGKQTLMAIPSKLKTIPQLLLQAKFHQECHESSAAIECYEQILRRENLAVEAIVALIDLDVNVNQYLLALQTNPIAYQLIPFLQAKISARNLDYSGALMQLKQNSSAIKSVSSRMWIALGDLSLKTGDSLGAFYAFQKARKMNNELLDHMDKLAALLKSQSKLIELNRLSYELLAIDDKRPEPWLALAHYMHMKNDLERALVYAEKAIRLGRRYPGGYQLKGVILLAAGRATESLICFKKAHKLCPDIYTFEGLVEACLALTMTKEALHVAKEALKLTPHHPRALAFVGMVLNRAGETEKAKKAFEAALGKDPKSIEAVLALITILCDQKQYPAALQHLLHYLPYHNTDWMHTRIGDIYLLANNDLISAHRHYQLALSINSEYEKAKEGVLRVEAALSKEKTDQRTNDDDEDEEVDDESREVDDVDFDITAEEF